MYKDIVTIVNQKSGVGKSTTVYALGMGLILKGYKVLFVDMDLREAKLTSLLNADMQRTSSPMLDLLMCKSKINEVIEHCDKADIIASMRGIDNNINIKEIKEEMLREALETVKGEYDYIIIDTPQALDIFTINALLAARTAIILHPSVLPFPVYFQTYKDRISDDILSLHEVHDRDIVHTVGIVKRYCSNIGGILLTRCESSEYNIIVPRLQKTIEDLNTKFFKTAIREDLAISEAQEVRQDIYQYAYSSNGVVDYRAFVEEYLREPMNSTLERTIKPYIKDISNGFKVVILTGQRQVGKSTLFKDLASKNRKYVTLDNLKFRQLAKNDPELFIQQNQPPVVIDEVQYAPELFPYIKIYVDEHQEEKGAFWLTGSQIFSLMQGVRESLAGRVAVVNLLGLSYKEKTFKPYNSKPFIPNMNSQDNGKKLNVLDIYRHIWEGSFPEPVTNKMIDRETFYSSYIQSYIARDVRYFYNVEKPVQLFYNFICAVAARTARLVNYESLANDVSIDLKTAKTWMGILEQSGIVYLLHPYYSNITKRIVKTPKVYFLDTGLCSYLTRWNTPENLMQGSMDGQILETYVLGEILKSYWHNGKQPFIYFYRDYNKNEVDFIIEENMTLYPIEVKKTAMPNKNDFKAFQLVSCSDKKIGLGAVICLQPVKIPLNADIVSIPVWEI
jgi:predicted AAA+ superfamily ATPase/cellulose biosynthesis protein BcsQ